MKAFVAGGTGGLGSAVCRALVAEGHAVAIGYLSNAIGAADLVRDLGGSPRVARYRIDVTDAAGVEAVISDAARAMGGLDIVVNAAAANVDGLLPNLSPEDVARLHAVNVAGAMNVARAALPHFIAAGGGRIVNFSSVLAERSMAGVSAYASTKGAIEALTRALAVEWGAKGVTVNAVAPGFIDAGLGRKPVAAAGDALRRWVPLRRPGSAEDVAGLVVFLVSERARYVTGAIVPVDGGLLAGAPSWAGQATQEPAGARST